MPGTVFVASLKAAVYANGFYVAPHHSALQLGRCPVCSDEFITIHCWITVKIETKFFKIILTVAISEIRVTAFNTGEAEAYAGHGAPGARIRVYVSSAPARNKIKPLDTFVSNVSGQLAEVSRSSASDTTGSDTEEEDASISTLEFDGDSDNMAGSIAKSSFFGLIVEDSGKTTMVIPDGPCALKGVTSASCEVLARYLGWHIKKRTVNLIIPAYFSQPLAHKIQPDQSLRAL